MGFFTKSNQTIAAKINKRLADSNDVNAEPRKAIALIHSDVVSGVINSGNSAAVGNDLAVPFRQEYVSQDSFRSPDSLAGRPSGQEVEMFDVFVHQTPRRGEK